MADADSQMEGGRILELQRVFGAAAEVALVGNDLRRAEPGSGARVDAAQEVLRTGRVPPDTEGCLGHAAETRTSRGVPAALATLMARQCGRVYLCGVDPREVGSEILRGLEQGTLALSGAMHRALGLPVPGHGLPRSCARNAVRFFDDTYYIDECQRKVHDLALDLAVAHDWRRIVDSSTRRTPAARSAGTHCMGPGS